MGLLDFFSRKNSAGALAKHAKRAANKRAQNPDRWASIQALGNMGTSDAVAALLQRFNIRVDPSITDQDEKELAMKGILRAGDEAIEPLKQFLRETQSIAWPLKILDQLVDDDELVAVLLEQLEEMNTDYERDPQRKVDIIAQLEDRQDMRIMPVVVRFLEDVNEGARFHAAATIGKQENAADARERLLDCFEKDESVRVKVQVLDVFIAHEWGLGAKADALSSSLPSGYSLDGELIKKTR